MQREWTLDTEQTMNEALERTIEAYPDREALVIGGTRVTYRQFGQQVEALAAGLSQAGVGPAENVGILLPNSLEGFLAFFAVMKIGAVAAPLNMRLGPHDLRYILDELDVTALITIAEVMGRPYVGMIQALRPGLPKLRQLIVMGGQSGDGVVALEELMAAGEGAAVPEVTAGPDDVCSIFCTSGTTGLPKGAMHTHRSALSICRDLVHAAQPGAMEVMLAPYPLFHIGGIVILSPVFYGHKMVVMPGFDPRGILQAIEAERVTAFAAVPLFMYAVLGVPDLKQFDLSSLRLVGGGGAPFPPDLIRALEGAFGSGLFFQGYGLTEAMWVSASTSDDPEEVQFYTVGLPSRVNAEVRIVDDEGRDLPAGAVGEVLCRATGTMKGYYNRPQETADAFDEEGWLITGDLGSVDERGVLRLVDRKKDMIKRGAEGIFPAEIEHYLMTHSKIQMAAVVGVPSPIGGEQIWAFVQPREGAELDAAEVVDYCRGQIATFKIPQEVRIVPSLPLTATQKVQKFKLREEARKELDG